MRVMRLRSGVTPRALAQVRAAPGVEWAQDEQGDVWLRAESLEACEGLPFMAQYVCEDSDSLVPLGCRLPVARLPKVLEWRSLEGWLRLVFPLAALPGELNDSDSIPLPLVRDHEERPPNVLLTTLEPLLSYVEEAAAVRLGRLRFAVSGDGEAVVLGEPLLPIRGQRYHLHECLALPIGQVPEFTLTAEALRQSFGLAKAEWALLRGDTFDRLGDDDFIPLTRSAVRLTYERLHMQDALAVEEEGG